MSGKETKDSKGKRKERKKGKKESGSKKKKRPAAETDAGARTVRIQKSPEAFPPQGLC